MNKNNPFGDEPPSTKKANPFGEEVTGEPISDGAVRLEQAARKIRGLRSQLGAEGLPPHAERELLDELSKALDAAAGALRALVK